MAIHDLGYRPWQGVLALPLTRWMVITAAGIRRAWQSNWIKRMIFFAWMPAVVFALGFFFWEQAVVRQDALREFGHLLRDVSPVRVSLDGISPSFQIEDEAVARHSIWSWLLYMFFRYPQGSIMFLMVGIVAPPLISQDVRSRAFLLYFSRPLDRWQYALGKLTTVWLYLLLISAAPALVLYVIGVFLSPSAQVIYDTWDLPLRILGTSALMILPMASLALCFSSLTQESRYAAFAWFAVWILGWFTYEVMTSVEANNLRHGRQVFFDQWFLVSLHHTLAEVESWVFGFSGYDDIQRPLMLLGAITVVSTAVLFRKISAPMRV